MGFQTPLYELSEYLGWTTSGKIQLPDFQRGYKWEDERVGVPAAVEPPMLLLDGQQRLTSLTQALSGKGLVSTAVATVFEKVNTGGLALNVFELLTATFAGDKEHYDQHGTDFRLNDDWQKTEAVGEDGADVPRTIQDAAFVESRLHSLRTRNAAAYKGIYSLLLANAARDWMEDKALDKVQYASLSTDIHHVFPKHWCGVHGIDDEHRESIVNKTAISARTNRTIGGSAPSAQLDGLLESHLISSAALREDDFSTFFADRRERLCQLIETAMGKAVQRDVDEGHSTEDSEQFEPEVEDRDPLMED